MGIVERTCAVIYLVPRTAVLGAILITGYLGGATATHVGVGDRRSSCRRWWARSRGWGFSFAIRGCAC